MKLLLISNSTNAGEEYLQYPLGNIRDFLGTSPVKALFIPWAGVTVTWDEYEKKVKERFNQAGHDVVSIHHFSDPAAAVKDAEAIVVGGGNTFRLAEQLHRHGLPELIRECVMSGTPYIGWSAGANVACPTICTTNDMPVVQPSSFEMFNLVKFQINPHYLDANPDGHAGETREMRIAEYTELNRQKYVVGLREGTMLLIENGSIRLIGSRNMRVFKYGSNPVELGPDDDASFLL
ncbi:MAG: dipeptidase PepE [Marinilabiliales bacterium]|nr:MAG: dipeptidase PepE [Marinilabiliales bacterium]